MNTYLKYSLTIFILLMAVYPLMYMQYVVNFLSGKLGKKVVPWSAFIVSLVVLGGLIVYAIFLIRVINAVLEYKGGEQNA